MEERLWLELYTRGKSVQPFFADNNIKNLIIYGAGELGSLFYNELKKYNITIDLVIDKDQNYFNNLNIVSCEQLSINVISDDALIVVCVSYTRGNKVLKEIYTNLYKKVNCKIILLLDILMLCYYKQIILPYCAKNMIRPYIINYPSYMDINNLSKYEKMLYYIPYNHIADNYYFYEDLYSEVDDYSEDYIQNVFTQSPLIKKGDIYVHSDIKSKYVNIVQHKRFTHFSPTTFKHTMHLIGHCDTLGYGVDDSRTIASCLQKLLNPENKSIAQYRVINHGVWGYKGNELWRVFETMKTISFLPGDLVVIMAERYFGKKHESFIYHYNMLNKSYTLFYNMQKEFNEPRNTPLLIDLEHLSYAGMSLVARTLYKLFANDGLIGNYEENLSKYSLHSYNGCIQPAVHYFIANNKDALRLYIESLTPAVANKDGDSGAIVMNCNPFTNGHRYLVEQAANAVSNLYIFVVEEDKSMFSYDERFELIKMGTSDLENVTVIASGKFILSTVTFPEYFSKETANNITIDSSLDIEIFAQYIAPALNITSRFVGEEPLDPITRQYNQSMHDILPNYGIKVVEIPRIKSSNDYPISASHVRSLLQKGDFLSISKIVPITTLDYLRKKFTNAS